jgi:hypothetical protein
MCLLFTNLLIVPDLNYLICRNQSKPPTDYFEPFSVEKLMQDFVVKFAQTAIGPLIFDVDTNQTLYCHGTSTMGMTSCTIR